MTETHLLDLNQIGQAFHSLGHARRLRLLQSLSRSNSTVPVTELSIATSIPLGSTSSHVKILEEADLVLKIPHGSHVYLVLNKETLTSLRDYINNLLEGATNGESRRIETGYDTSEDSPDGRAGDG